MPYAKTQTNSGVFLCEISLLTNTTFHTCELYKRNIQIKQNSNNKTLKLMHHLSIHQSTTEKRAGKSSKRSQLNGEEYYWT